ncbi:MAG: hypothetical protein U0N03_07970, partial [Lachnospiraceae bacterium]
SNGFRMRHGMSSCRIQSRNKKYGNCSEPNKISKTGLKMQAFSAFFMKFCLALNSYKICKLAVDLHGK